MLRSLIGVILLCWLTLIAMIGSAVFYGVLFPGIGSLTFQYNPASLWTLDLRTGVTAKLEDLPMLGSMSPTGEQLLFTERGVVAGEEITLYVENRLTGMRQTIGSYRDGAFIWAYEAEYLLWITGRDDDDTVDIQRITVNSGEVLSLGGFFAPDYGFYANGRFVSFSPDRRLVSLLRFTPENQPSQALIFDLLTGEMIWERDLVLWVDWSTDGNWLTLQSANDFSIVQMEDVPVSSGEFRGEFIGFAPAADVGFFVRDRTLYRLDLKDDADERVTSVLDDVQGFAFSASTGVISPSGRYLLATRADTTYLLNTETGELFSPVVGRAGAAVQLQWSPDERYILWQAAAEERRVLIYDVNRRHIVTDLSSRNPLDTFRLPTYIGWYDPD